LVTRRVPGTHLGGRVTNPGRPVTPEGPTTSRDTVRRDPEAERSALDGFMSGFARGSERGAGGTDQRPTAEQERPT